METIHQLYKRGSYPVGSWFVLNQNLSNWHIAFLKTDIINVKNGPGEEFYYESWDALKDAAFRVDQEGYNWCLLEADNTLYEVREDFDRFGEDSPL